MLTLLYLLIFISVSFLTLIRCRSIFRINVIFTFIWCLCASLSCYGILGMRIPGAPIHYFVVVTIIVFNLFYLLRITSNPLSNKDDSTPEVNIRMMLLYILNVVSLISLLPYCLISLRRFLSTGILGYRGDLIKELSANDYTLFFIREIPSAIFSVTIFIFAVLLFTKKSNKIIAAIVIIDLLVFTIVFGGRYLILRFIVTIIITWLAFNSTRLKMRKIKVRYILFSILFILLVTQIRLGNNYTIVENFSLYYVGPLSFLDLIMHNTESFNIFTEYYYGYFTFAPFFEPIVLFLKFTFGVNWEVPSYLINMYTQNFYNIGSSNLITFNNSTTMLYPFLRDYGYLGLIIGPAILGGIVGCLERRFLEKHSIKSLILYVFLCNVLIDSVLSYTLISTQSGITILLILYLVKNQARKKNTELIGETSIIKKVP